MKSMSFLHEKGFYVLSEGEGRTRKKNENGNHVGFDVKSPVSLRIKKKSFFKQFYTKHYLNARDGRRLHS